MDKEALKKRLMQIEQNLRILEPQTVKKSSIDVDYAVKTGEYQMSVSEHNILNAILGLHERLDQLENKK